MIGLDSSGLFSAAVRTFAVEAPRLIAPPSILGVAQISTTLTAVDAAFSGVPEPRTTITWLVDDVPVGAGPQYTPVPQDDGKTIVLRCAATSAVGAVEAETAPVVLRYPPPVIAGTLDDVMASAGDASVLRDVGALATYAAGGAWSVAVDGVVNPDCATVSADGVVTIRTGGVWSGDVVVRYMNSGGAASVSCRVVISAPTSVPGVMAAPTLAPLSPTAIAIACAASPTDNGSPILRHDLRWSADGAIWTTVSGVAAETILADLAPATVHWAQTRAVNAVGAGPWSPTATAGTLAVPPTLTLGHVIEGRRLTIRVNDLSGAPTPTLALEALTLDGADIRAEATGDASWSYVAPSSNAARILAWTVRASNAGGTATASGTAMLAPDLTVPARMAAPALSGGEEALTLTFGPASADGGVAIDLHGYEVAVASDVDFVAPVAQGTQAGPVSILLSHVAPSAYVARSRVRNALGWGAWSAASLPAEVTARSSTPPSAAQWSLLHDAYADYEEQRIVAATAWVALDAAYLASLPAAPTALKYRVNAGTTRSVAMVADQRAAPVSTDFVDGLAVNVVIALTIGGVDTPWTAAKAFTPRRPGNRRIIAHGDGLRLSPTFPAAPLNLWGAGVSKIDAANAALDAWSVTSIQYQSAAAAAGALTRGAQVIHSGRTASETADVLGRPHAATNSAGKILVKRAFGAIGVSPTETGAAALRVGGAIVAYAVATQERPAWAHSVIEAQGRIRTPLTLPGGDVVSIDPSGAVDWRTPPAARAATESLTQQLWVCNEAGRAAVALPTDEGAQRTVGGGWITTGGPVIERQSGWGAPVGGVYTKTVGAGTAGYVRWWFKRSDLDAGDGLEIAVAMSGRTAGSANVRLRHHTEGTVATSAAIDTNETYVWRLAVPDRAEGSGDFAVEVYATDAGALSVAVAITRWRPEAVELIRQPALGLAPSLARAVWSEGQEFHFERAVAGGQLRAMPWTGRYPSGRAWVQGPVAIRQPGGGTVWVTPNTVVGYRGAALAVVAQPGVVLEGSPTFTLSDPAKTWDGTAAVAGATWAEPAGDNALLRLVPNARHIAIHLDSEMDAAAEVQVREVGGATWYREQPLKRNRHAKGTNVQTAADANNHPLAPVLATERLEGQVGDLIPGRTYEVRIRHNGAIYTKQATTVDWCGILADCLANPGAHKIVNVGSVTGQIDVVASGAAGTEGPNLIKRHATGWTVLRGGRVNAGGAADHCIRLANDANKVLIVDCDLFGAAVSNVYIPIDGRDIGVMGCRAQAWGWQGVPSAATCLQDVYAYELSHSAIWSPPEGDSGYPADAFRDQAKPARIAVVGCELGGANWPANCWDEQRWTGKTPGTLVDADTSLGTVNIHPHGSSAINFYEGSTGGCYISANLFRAGPSSAFNDQIGAFRNFHAYCGAFGHASYVGHNTAWDTLWTDDGFELDGLARQMRVTHNVLRSRNAIRGPRGQGTQEHGFKKLKGCFTSFSYAAGAVGYSVNAYSLLVRHPSMVNRGVAIKFGDDGDVNEGTEFIHLTGYAEPGAGSWENFFGTLATAESWVGIRNSAFEARYISSGGQNQLPHPDVPNTSLLDVSGCVRWTSEVTGPSASTRRAWAPTTNTSNARIQPTSVPSATLTFGPDYAPVVGSILVPAVDKVNATVWHGYSDRIGSGSLTPSIGAMQPMAAP